MPNSEMRENELLELAERAKTCNSLDEDVAMEVFHEGASPSVVIALICELRRLRLERAEARREANESVNGLIASVENLMKRAGNNYKDWVEVADSIAALRSKLAAPEKEETNG